MTARSVSWIDPRKVADLLSQVSSDRPAARPVAVRPMGAILPPKSRGRAASPAASVPKAPPRQAPSPAAEAPEQAPSPAAGHKARRVPERLAHTSDNPSDRIDALVVWVLDNFPCSGAFLADDNGLTLAAHGITEAHVSIVGPLLSSLVGIRAVPGVDATAGALWLGAQMMSWVEARNDRGGFCLGTVGAEALDSTSLALLKDALSDTIRGM